MWDWDFQIKTSSKHHGSSCLWHANVSSKVALASQKGLKRLKDKTRRWYVKTFVEHKKSFELLQIRKSFASAEEVWRYCCRWALPVSLITREETSSIPHWWSLISQVLIFLFAKSRGILHSQIKIGSQCVLVGLCLVLFYSVGVCFTGVECL